MSILLSAVDVYTIVLWSGADSFCQNFGFYKSGLIFVAAPSPSVLNQFFKLLGFDMNNIYWGGDWSFSVWAMALC